MKYIFLIVVLVSIAPTVGAQDCTNNDKYACFLKLGCETIPQCIEFIVKYIVTLAAPVAAVFIIYAGFLFVVSQGDPKKLQTAKSTLTWTIIGLAVTVGAWTLAIAFRNFFTDYL